MNYRALTLGAIVGFVVAFSPACGQTKCGPQNCDGCCDSKGTCVKKPNNGNNTTCGSAGNACTDCAAGASTCNPTTFTCGSTGAGGGGGGGGTGGGTGTCDGCTLPSGTCVGLARTTVINCGKDAEMCRACATGETCTNGVCTMPQAMKKVGDTCATDGECQMALGNTAFCKLMTTSGNGTYTGGYCTVRCGTAANQCPSGSSCVGLQPQYGEGDTFCWDNCNTSTDRCRTGYGCYMLSTGSACWLSPIPPLDAGVPADKVGNACTNAGDCDNPPETGAVCLTREENFNWQGGYCSKSGCFSNTECATDGGALCLDFENDSLCVQRCADSADAGQSTCRNGYRCQNYFFNDGGASTDGFCVPPPAPTPTTIGEGCMTDVDCQVPAGAIADCIPGTLPDGGNSGYTGGECTRFNCGSDTDCSEDGGAQCFTISQDGLTACFKGCAASGAGQSTCRAGFVCEAYRQADGGLSVDGICSPACNAPGSGCPTGQTCNATTGYCQ